MKTPLTYGLGAAFVSAIVTLLMHLTGLSTDASNMILAMAIGLPAVIIILLTAIVLGTRRARTERAAAEGFSYGQAFKVGLLVAVFSAVGSAVFHVLYYTFLFPEFAEVAIEWTQSLMERMGARASDIERVIEDMRTKSTITRQVTTSVIFTVCVGTVMSLITAAVLKRPPVDEPVAAPPTLA